MGKGEKGKRGLNRGRKKTYKNRKQNRKQNLVAVNDHVVVVAVINGIIVVVVILVAAGWSSVDWVRGEFDVARVFCGLADGRFGLTVLLVILLALPRSVSLLALISICRSVILLALALICRGGSTISPSLLVLPVLVVTECRLRGKQLALLLLQ
jgi:hypothetical protein